MNTTAKSSSAGKQSISTKSMVIIAMFTAVLCISAYLSIPLPNGSHISIVNFTLLLIALSFPLEQSFFITLLWLLIGSVGVPVFPGGVAGFGYLISHLGGYALSFLPVAILAPLLRGKQYHRIRYTVIAILAAILIDAFGMFQWLLLGQISPEQAFFAAFLPFLPLDLLKAVIVAQIVPAFQHLLYSAE